MSLRSKSTYIFFFFLLLIFLGALYPSPATIFLVLLISTALILLQVFWVLTDEEKVPETMEAEYRDLPNKR